jgi:large subunit ribosomal protein L25
MIPVHLMGAAIGVKLGGVLEHLCREIEIECLPMDVPASVEIDISALQIGDSVHVSDLKVNDQVRILDDPSTTVALGAAPTVETAPAEEARVAAEGETPAAASEEKAKEE